MTIMDAVRNIRKLRVHHLGSALPFLQAKFSDLLKGIGGGK